MPATLVKQKLRAALTNLWISAFLLGAILALVYLVWYPYPYSRIQGIDRITWILVAVQLALGPLLTAIVYRKGKKTLKLDLAVITALQLFAMGYGTVALYLERPWFMVYAVDRFSVLARRDVDSAAIADGRFSDKPWIGPVMVIANMPTDAGERQRLLEETLFERKPELERRPRYWSDYAEGFDQLATRARTLAELRAARPATELQIDRVIRGSGSAGFGLVWVPVRGKYRDFALVLERDSGAVLDAIATNPWLR